MLSRFTYSLHQIFRPRSFLWYALSARCTAYTSLTPISPLQTVFALCATPTHSLSRLPHIVFWIWLHLLQFNVSNQCLSTEEDKRNKPSRPVASGRICLRDALVLRWTLASLCFLTSLAYSTQLVYVSTVLIALTIIYNELQMHATHWALRNILNALGYAAFEAGATLVAGTPSRH